MQDPRCNPCVNCGGSRFLFTPWKGSNHKPPPNTHLVSVTASFLLEAGGIFSNDKLVDVTFTLRVCIGCSAATTFVDDLAALSELAKHPGAQLAFVDATQPPTGNR